MARADSAILTRLSERLRRARNVWVAWREKRRMIAVACEMLKHDDRLLIDVGLPRGLLEQAIERPERFESLDAIRRAASADPTNAARRPARSRPAHSHDRGGGGSAQSHRDSA